MCLIDTQEINQSVKEEKRWDSTVARLVGTKSQQQEWWSLSQIISLVRSDLIFKFRSNAVPDQTRVRLDLSHLSYSYTNFKIDSYTLQVDIEFILIQPQVFYNRIYGYTQWNIIEIFINTII